MTRSTYVWIGPADGKLSDPANWIDAATHTVATTRPTGATTLVFRAGTYSATCITKETGAGDEVTGVHARKLLLLPGAHVTLNTHSAFSTNPRPGVFGFEKIVAGADSSLTMSGAALFSQRTVLNSGAVLDGRAASLVVHLQGEFPIELGSLNNHGGTVLLGDAQPFAASLVGNVLNAVHDIHHPGPGFAQTNGFLPSESVLPGPTALRIDLGDLHQGSTMLPLQFAAVDLTQSPGFTDLTIGARGDGFTTALFPSIAAAFGPFPGVGGYVPIGAVQVDTSSLGSHREFITLDNGRAAVERLVITDRIV